MMRKVLAGALLSLGWVLPADAASYRNMTDVNLVAEAPVIAEVRILAHEPGPGLYTDYQVEVVMALKGFMPGSALVVRVPDGYRSEGLRMQLSGVPRFNEGERALLFLRPGQDGAYRIFQLALGAFHEVENRGRKLAMRDLSDALVFEAGGTGRAVERVRDFEGFKNWIRERTLGVTAQADYFVDLPDGGLRSLQEFFTLFESDGLNLRWTVFNTGGNVTFFAHQDGHPGLEGGGFDEFQTALQVWNDDPGTPIDLLYGGTNNLTGGLTTFDNVNTLVFEDPNNNDLFGGEFSCTSGGVIAIAGPWFAAGDTHTFNGMTFLRIQGADLIVNKNTGCFLSQNKGAEEVFAHELGHTLGLRHSCNDADSGACDTTDKAEALMNANAHGDGRGAQLGNDDRAGIAFLYDEVSQEPCVSGPTTLCLNDDRFQVEVDWRTPQGNSGPGMAEGLTRDTGYFWFFSPNNVEMVLKVLDACGPFDRFWVFAGGLTNVEVDITVTDTVSGQVKSYQNPLNTAFQPIQDTQAFATCP